MTVLPTTRGVLRIAPRVCSFHLRVPAMPLARIAQVSDVLVSLSTDSVYFGAANNYVYCLDVSSGELKWRYRTRGPVVSSPAVEDGIVYVGSLDRKLYAIAS